VAAFTGSSILIVNKSMDYIFYAEAHPAYRPFGSDRPLTDNGEAGRHRRRF